MLAKGSRVDGENSESESGTGVTIGRTFRIVLKLP
jgi:hypothetical protein